MRMVCIWPKVSQGPNPISVGRSDPVHLRKNGISIMSGNYFRTSSTSVEMGRTYLGLVWMAIPGLVTAQNTCTTALPIVPGTYMVTVVDGLEPPAPLCVTPTVVAEHGEWYTYTPAQDGSPDLRRSRTRGHDPWSGSQRPGRRPPVLRALRASRDRERRFDQSTLREGVNAAMPRMCIAAAATPLRRSGSTSR